MKLKIAFLCTLLISLALFQVASAQDVITDRTGTIVITMPDGTFVTVGVDDAVPDIPSGATIEVISGTIAVAPEAGSVTVIVGNTQATVTAGQAVEVSLDLTTGAAEVTSTAGTIQTVTAGVAAAVPAGATATITADAATGEVSIAADGGSVTVTEADGTVVTVAAGTSVSTEAAAGSEITTPTGETPAEEADEAEEPPEPESPEGSGA